MITPDVQAAGSQIVLALVFWPLAYRDWKRGYCHTPLFVSVPKLLAMGSLADALLRLGAPLAALVSVPDLLCWAVLIGQRLVMGDGSQSRGQQMPHYLRDLYSWWVLRRGGVTVSISSKRRCQ